VVDKSVTEIANHFIRQFITKTADMKLSTEEPLWQWQQREILIGLYAFVNAHSDSFFDPDPWERAMMGGDKVNKMCSEFKAGRGEILGTKDEFSALIQACRYGLTASFVAERYNALNAVTVTCLTRPALIALIHQLVTNPIKTSIETHTPIYRIITKPEQVVGVYMRNKLKAEKHGGVDLDGFAMLGLKAEEKAAVEKFYKKKIAPIIKKNSLLKNVTFENTNSFVCGYKNGGWSSLFGMQQAGLFVIHQNVNASHDRDVEIKAYTEQVKSATFEHYKANKLSASNKLTELLEKLLFDPALSNMVNLPQLSVSATTGCLIRG